MDHTPRRSAAAGKPLRELLIEAIRYGERPDVKAKLTQIVEHAVDRSRLQDLIEERALAKMRSGALTSARREAPVRERSPANGRR